MRRQQQQKPSIYNDAFLTFAGVDNNEVWYPAMVFFGGSQNPRNREDLGKNERFHALKKIVSMRYEICNGKASEGSLTQFLIRFFHPLLGDHQRCYHCHGEEFAGTCTTWLPKWRDLRQGWFTIRGETRLVTGKTRIFCQTTHFF